MIDMELIKKIDELKPHLSKCNIILCDSDFYEGRSIELKNIRIKTDAISFSNSATYHGSKGTIEIKRKRTDDKRYVDLKYEALHSVPNDVLIATVFFRPEHRYDQLIFDKTMAVTNVIRNELCKTDSEWQLIQQLMRLSVAYDVMHLCEKTGMAFDPHRVLHDFDLDTKDIRKILDSGTSNDPESFCGKCKTQLYYAHPTRYFKGVILERSALPGSCHPTCEFRNEIDMDLYKAAINNIYNSAGPEQSKLVSTIVYNIMRQDSLIDLLFLYDTLDFDKMDTYGLIALLRTSSVYKDSIPKYKQCISVTSEKLIVKNLDVKKQLWGLI